MQKKIFFYFILSLLLTNPSHAQTPDKKKSVTSSHSEHKSGEKHEHAAQLIKAGKDKVIVKVKGMVCAFCAQGIEKNLGKKEEVQSTKVDLDKMNVEIQFKKGKSLSSESIKQIITDAGFKFVSME